MRVQQILITAYLNSPQNKSTADTVLDYTTDEAAISNSSAVMLTSVAVDRYAIGYVSLGSLTDSVKAVKIDDYEASVANINNVSYKICRPFIIAVKDNLSSPAHDFFTFILSGEVQTSDSTTGVTNAIDGIAVIVNKENSAASLTKDQVQKIFAG